MFDFIHPDKRLDWRIILVAFLLIIFSALSDENMDFEQDPQTVTRVIDGDTIELANGERVRYIGIDTPESVHPNKEVECFARQASKKNEELVLGKVVTLERDISDKDRYGRLLRYVYVEDKFINLELVSLGYAYSDSYPPDVSQQDILDEAENLAREKNLGLWAQCENNN